MHSAYLDSRTNSGSHGVLYLFGTEQQHVCVSFEGVFGWNCCIFLKTLTIEKLSVTDITGGSYVNIAVYSECGVCASVLVTTL